MYPETKEAVRRTMRVCQILWSMDPEEYKELLLVTDEIKFPSRDEIAIRLRERFKDEMIGDEEFARLIDAELIEELRTKYSDAAIDAGFDAEQGLAMLEYAAILRDLEDDGYEE
jgi:hypothetical protein